MKKISILLCMFALVNLAARAQQTPKPFDLYHPDENAQETIDKAVRLAKEQQKFVFIQIGGNWCKWCRIFHEWSHATPAVDSLFGAGFVVIHVNYSKENKNAAVLKNLGYPQRFGFPVFVILDGNGNRIHTQNTAYLESGEGYSEEKVTEFLQQWSPKAFDAAEYK